MAAADMSYVGGNAGDNDLRVTNDVDGTIINAGAGNDVLRGGRYDDILSGGAGDDLYFGGGGADQFRFFGNQIEGTSDLDKIFDLNFGEGDTLVFGNYGAGTFSDAAGINAFGAGNTEAQISSWQGLASFIQNSGAVVGFSEKGNTDVLILSIDNGAGQIQTIHITGGYDAVSAFFVA